MLSIKQVRDFFYRSNLSQFIIDEICRVTLKSQAGETLNRQEIDLLQIISEYMSEVRV